MTHAGRQTIWRKPSADRCDDPYRIILIVATTNATRSLPAQPEYGAHTILDPTHVVSLAEIIRRDQTLVHSK